MKLKKNMKNWKTGIISSYELAIMRTGFMRLFFLSLVLCGFYVFTSCSEAAAKDDSSDSVDPASHVKGVFFLLNRFEAADQDGNLVLDKSEIMRSFKKKGREIVVNLVSNPDGSITLKELRAIACNNMKVNSETAMIRYKNTLDSNQDGFLEQSEIAELIDPQKTQEILQDFDLDGDLRLSPVEYSKLEEMFLNNLLRGKMANHIRFIGKLNNGEIFSEGNMQRSMRLIIDTDNNRFIDRQEFIRYLKKTHTEEKLEYVKKIVKLDEIFGKTKPDVQPVVDAAIASVSPNVPSETVSPASVTPNVPLVTVTTPASVTPNVPLVTVTTPASVTPNVPPVTVTTPASVTPNVTPVTVTTLASVPAASPSHTATVVASVFKPVPSNLLPEKVLPVASVAKIVPLVSPSTGNFSNPGKTPVYTSSEQKIVRKAIIEPEKPVSKSVEALSEKLLLKCEPEELLW
ncbi:MAG: hypothetical protein HQM10_16670 [Candidatus Riflebacteria bacterium]|nr:hypothetical protein [Candidatus Riflebacteria bacterium]